MAVLANVPAPSTFSRDRLKSRPRLPGFTECECEILDRLDIIAIYDELGLKALGPASGAKVTVRAKGETDRDPSAVIFLDSGRYFASNTGESYSLWEYAAEVWGCDWRDARQKLADRVNVQLPKTGGSNSRSQGASEHSSSSASPSGRRPPAKARQVEAPDFSGRVQPMQWNPGTRRLVYIWSTQFKPGVSVEAAEAAGGQVCNYLTSKGRRHGRVLALPCYAPGVLKGSPIGLTFYNLDGSDFVTFGSKHKIKTFGTGNSLVGLHALLRMSNPSEKVIWKTAGPSDLLALWTAIPSELREKHLIISNAHGEANGVSYEMAELFRGWKVNVVHDADVPGERGVREKWLSALAGVAAEVRHVRLPYEIAEKHGKDVRDFLNEGHSFGDLLAIAEATPAFEPGDNAGASGAKEVGARAPCDS